MEERVGERKNRNGMGWDGMQVLRVLLDLVFVSQSFFSWVS